MTNRSPPDSVPITYLTRIQRIAPSLPSWSPSLVASDRFQTKVEQVKKKRYLSFFRRKQANRALVTATNMVSTSPLVRKLIDFMSMLSRKWQSLWKRMFSKTALWLHQNSSKRILDVLKKAYKRIRGPSAADLLAQEMARKSAKAERMQQLMKAFRNRLAVQGRKQILFNQNKYRREMVKCVAKRFVSDTIGTRLPRLARSIADKNKARAVCIIQYNWRFIKLQRDRTQERLSRLSDIMTSSISIIEDLDRSTHNRRCSIHMLSKDTMHGVYKSVAKLLAIRLLQRVWRGARTRIQVDQWLDKRKRRALAKLRRERLRRAREALLNPTEVELRQRREIENRVKSRVPALPTFASNTSYKDIRLHRRSLLEPLPWFENPPKQSHLAGARTLRMPFTRYSKILSQNARVNHDNVWVAIPIEYHCTDKLSSGNPQQSLHSSIPLSPVKVRGRQRYFQAKYDWMPSRLLKPTNDIKREQEQV